MLITMKFGGTSVGDADRIRSAAGLVAREVERGNRVVVVTSAMSGVTNKLVDLLDRLTSFGAEDQECVPEFFRFTRSLENDHVEAAKKAIRDPQLAEAAASALYTERHGLERVLLGTHFLGELTPVGYDFIVSQGERMCVPILANCLKDLGVDAVGLGAEGCGIMTDDNYGSARPLEAETRQGVRERLLPLLDAGQVPVAGGFFMDFYEFNGTVGTPITLSLTSTQFDAYVLLMAPSGAISTNDDANAATTDAQLNGTLLESGIYTIGVSSFNPGESGNYDLSLTSP